MDFKVLLILLLPLAGATINGLVGLFAPGYRKNESLIGWLATACVAIPFVLTATLFFGAHGTEVVTFYQWAAVGDFSIDVAFRLDQLSLLMTMIVTGVGALIHVYSIGYMHGDDGFWRFFAYLNLFIFMMLNLVLSDNLVGLFLGWEGVGLCSYLLIGFWYTDLNNSSAAMKAFIVNRIGDFAFLIAMFIIVKEVGALDFDSVMAGASNMSASTVSWVVGLMFIGATGKSAQIPLYTWLPDAMAGPTPVSALIHAATMVTSGLYLLARMSPVVLEAPVVMMIIALVGGFTAIFAATIAIAQNDIKKVLAYSTVSQLGYMFLATGCGAFFVAIFHVMTHAFFKACLFLGSGSVIHAMHHVEHELEHNGHEEHFDPQDMRTMGGLKKYMPSTYWTFLIATFAISGFPLLAGFFSKDEILFKVFQEGYGGSNVGYMLWGFGIVTALLTAFYMTRALILTFHGEERWPDADKIHPHESPWTMTLPLWVLGGLSIGAGWLGVPHLFEKYFGMSSWIHHFLGGSFGGPVAERMDVAEISAGLETILIAIGASVGIIGIAFAWIKYSKQGVEFDESVKSRFGGLYRLWENKYYVDEIYQKIFVGPLVNFSEKGLAVFDSSVIDGAVNGVGNLATNIGDLFRKSQTGVVQNYALAIATGVVMVLGVLFFFVTQ